MKKIFSVLILSIGIPPGTAREFYVTYTDSGGELSSVDFANDRTSTHFVYDTYIYLTDPSQVQNIEMDMN